MSLRSVRLQEDIAAKLAVIAEKVRRSGNWIVNEALREYFARQEFEEKRWQETLVALEDVKRGNLVDGEEVFAWMRSWFGDHELPMPVPSKRLKRK